MACSLETTESQMRIFFNTRSVRFSQYCDENQLECSARVVVTAVGGYADFSSRCSEGLDLAVAKKAVSLN